MAKFEVCCHRFADLSEYNYGVSIINDSKYGFATVGNVMRLSLLRSPKAPDGNADMGHHRIRWAIAPHNGSLSSQTVRAAANFNNSLKLVGIASPKLSSVQRISPIELTGSDNLILDWIKRGEDDELISVENLPKKTGKSIVIRIYDALGGTGTALVRSAFKLEKVTKTNVLEDDLEEISVQNESEFAVQLGPFEVATYRLQLKE